MKQNCAQAFASATTATHLCQNKVRGKSIPAINIIRLNAMTLFRNERTTKLIPKKWWTRAWIDGWTAHRIIILFMMKRWVVYSEWLYPGSTLRSYRMGNVTVTTKPIDLTSICQRQEHPPKRLADACIFTAENVILESPPSHTKDQKHTLCSFRLVWRARCSVCVCVYVCKCQNGKYRDKGRNNCKRRRRLKPINILVVRISFHMADRTYNSYLLESFCSVVALLLCCYMAMWRIVTRRRQWRRPLNKCDEIEYSASEQPSENGADCRVVVVAISTTQSKWARAIIMITQLPVDSVKS